MENKICSVMSLRHQIFFCHFFLSKSDQKTIFSNVICSVSLHKTFWFLLLTTNFTFTTLLEGSK